MSTRTTESRLYPCEGPDCQRQRPADGVDGSYCSVECSRRAAGQKILRHVQQDHRLCMGCFRATKEVERPPERAPEFVVGFEYLAEHGQLGETERRPAHTTGGAPYRRAWLDHDCDASAPADRLVATGVVCTCGTTDHQDAYVRRERVISIRDATERLCGLLERLGWEGQHDKRVDARLLARTIAVSIRERGRADWPLAVGRALQESEP